MIRSKENFNLMVGETNYSNDVVNVEHIKVANTTINRVTLLPGSLSVECVGECFVLFTGSLITVNGESTIMGDAGFIEGDVKFENNQAWPMDFMIIGKIKIKEQE